MLWPTRSARTLGPRSASPKVSPCVLARGWHATKGRSDERQQHTGHMAADLDSLGAPGRTRTCDPLLRRQLLYPTELRAPGTTLCMPKVTCGPRAGSLYVASPDPAIPARHVAAPGPPRRQEAWPGRVPDTVRVPGGFQHQRSGTTPNVPEYAARARRAAPRGTRPGVPDAPAPGAPFTPEGHPAQPTTYARRTEKSDR